MQCLVVQEDSGRIENIKTLRNFIRKANYHRRFVKNYASLILPLVKIAHSNSLEGWTCSHVEIMQIIIERIHNGMNSIEVKQSKA